MGHVPSLGHGIIFAESRPGMTDIEYVLQDLLIETVDKSWATNVVMRSLLPLYIQSKQSSFKVFVITKISDYLADK